MSYADENSELDPSVDRFISKPNLTALLRIERGRAAKLQKQNEVMSFAILAFVASLDAGYFEIERPHSSCIQGLRDALAMTRAATHDLTILAAE